jgi:hypothetical protein
MLGPLPKQPTSRLSPKCLWPSLVRFPITYILDSLYSPCMLLGSQIREIWTSYRSAPSLASGRWLRSCNLASFQHAKRPLVQARPDSFSRVSSATRCPRVSSVSPTANSSLPLHSAACRLTLQLPFRPVMRTLSDDPFFTVPTDLDSNFRRCTRATQHHLLISPTKSACVRGPHGPPPLSRLLQIEPWAN